MSRRQELCRDFQRGNCQYGSRCKYLHELPQQQRNQQPQRPQQQPRYQQQRNQFGGGGNYYNVLGNNSNNANRRQAQNQTLQSKDHKCNDPRICKDQIKEDMANEHPSFWRLTSYAHYKFLPNDIVGDVSPEELRALAYEGAKQGLSLKDVVQRERAMMAAKSAEFDTLLRNPYNGPAQPAPGFQSTSFTSSPFLSPPGKASPFTSFGQPANISTNGPPQVFAQTPFGDAPGTPFNFGKPSGDVQFGKHSANLSSQSPFGKQTNPFQQSPFGSTASPALQNPFGGTGLPVQQNPFPNLQGPSLAGNQIAFPSPSPFVSPPASTTQTSFPVNQSQPGFHTLGTPANAFQTPITPAVVDTPAVVPQTTPTIPSQVASMKTEDWAVWLKDVWKIGEIPEGEPPPEVRF